MDYDKLIEQLNARGLGNGSSLGYHCGLFDEASTALEASWRENQALRGLINGLDAELSHVRADLARVTAERDAALVDLRKWKVCATCKQYNPHGQKSNCKVKKAYLPGGNWTGCSKWEWKGIKEG